MTDKKIARLVNDAHSLRDVVYPKGTPITRDGAGNVLEIASTDLDYLRRPTAGRITVEAAIRKYGHAVLRRALDSGRVYVVSPHRGEAGFFDYHRALANRQWRLQANGQTIA